MHRVKIALIQYRIGQNPWNNYEKAIFLMEKASSKGAHAVCFPELQFSPFFPQFPKTKVSKYYDVKDYIFTINNKIIKLLQKKCQELRLISFPNFYLKEGSKFYDTSLVIDSDGSVIGTSKMVHILEAPCFHEKDYYAPSNEGFLVHETSIGKIGVVICYDRHFPESIRSCALMGASLIVIPAANIKGEPLEIFEWELRVSAFQNNVFIAMCNRVGIEYKMHFCGESIIVNPDSEVIAKGSDSEDIIFSDLDFEIIERSRKKRPFLDLRRPKFYLDI